MMPPTRRKSPGFVWGVILIAAGSVMLLQQLGGNLLASASIPGLLFLVGGGAFLSVFLRDRQQWWAMIPAAALAAVGATILAGEGGVDGSSAFFGVLSLGFFGVYLWRREQWWALIPAGVMVSLALTTSGLASGGGVDEGGLFFLGLSATFAAVWLLAAQRWAIWPAGALLALSLLASDGFAPLALLGSAWPFLLLGFGAWLAFGPARARDEEAPEPEQEAPRRAA